MLIYSLLWLWEKLGDGCCVASGLIRTYSGRARSCFYPKNEAFLKKGGNKNGFLKSDLLAVDSKIYGKCSFKKCACCHFSLLKAGNNTWEVLLKTLYCYSYIFVLHIP